MSSEMLDKHQTFFTSLFPELYVTISTCSNQKIRPKNMSFHIKVEVLQA